jgi:hypothetical protein
VGSLVTGGTLVADETESIKRFFIRQHVSWICRRNYGRGGELGGLLRSAGLDVLGTLVGFIVVITCGLAHSWLGVEVGKVTVVRLRYKVHKRSSSWCQGQKWHNRFAVVHQTCRRPFRES